MNLYHSLHDLMLVSPPLAKVELIKAVPHWCEQFMFAGVLILGFAFLFQGVWNGILAEFPQIGRLSYFRAVHVMAFVGMTLSFLAYLMW